MDDPTNLHIDGVQNRRRTEVQLGVFKKSMSIKLW